MGMGMFMCRVF